MASDRRILRPRIALPGDHGSWVFLVSPLLIGLTAGGRWTTPCFYLVVASLAGFLVRQPATVAVKVLSRRRVREDLLPALFWTAFYTLVAGLHVLGLVLRGFGYLLYLAIPGLAVFLWHLWLVARREERRQVLLEVLAAGVLALTAPAGLWAGKGAPVPLGWLLWLLTWAQAASSILFVYLRLEQRRWKEAPATGQRHRAAAPALLSSIASLAAVAGLSLGGVLPRWLAVAYLPQLTETLRGFLRPASPDLRPTAIGLRQLAVSALFTLLFVLFWR